MPMPMKLNVFGWLVGWFVLGVFVFCFCFSDNNLYEIPDDAAEYSPNFWRTNHRKHFAWFIELHLLFKGIQIKSNFPAEIKEEFPGDAECARPVPTASELSQCHSASLETLSIFRNTLWLSADFGHFSSSS